MTTHALKRVVRSWRERVEVLGESMAPGLRPGDWLLVDPDSFRERAPRAGELVVTADPRDPRRMLVKRVADVGSDGRMHLTGDALGASTDSRVFGPVPVGDVAGRPWFRYWPPRRIGPVR